MRRSVYGVVAIVGLAAGMQVVDARPVDAASGFIDVAKAVVGPGPTGPYTIEVECPGSTPTPATFELNDGDSETVAVQFNDPGFLCTVTETGTQGGTVGYECSATPPGGFCRDDETVFVQSGGAQIDITNTFPESEAEPATAEPVEAAPTFTG